jgi:hypothetical protein
MSAASFTCLLLSAEIPLTKLLPSHWLQLISGRRAVNSYEDPGPGEALKKKHK